MGKRFIGTLEQLSITYGLSTWLLRKLAKQYRITPITDDGRLYHAHDIEKCIRRYHFERDMNVAFLSRSVQSMFTQVGMLTEQVSRLAELLNILVRGGEALPRQSGACPESMGFQVQHSITGGRVKGDEESP